MEVLRAGHQRGTQHGVTPMDVFTQFYDSVLSHIPRATPVEQDEIRQELQDHLEDHRDLLMEHGFGLLDAKKRAVETMGDPEEIGRAWNSHLSPVWLWIGRISKVCSILLILFMLWPLAIQLGGAFENLSGRFEVEPHRRSASSDYEAFWSQNVDIRQEFGEHIIRIYQVELAQNQAFKDDTSAAPGFSIPLGEYCISVYMMTYAKNPFHYAMENVLQYAQCNGEESPSGGGGGSGTGCTYWTATYPIAKGAETALVTLDLYDNHFSAELELDWGGVS